jgi:HPt (histidine-containing phosphotransfer) domain-containing protein
MDGLEASRAICERWPMGQRPRIVAMTAEGLQGDRERCLAAGMEDYLVKPVTLKQLEAALAGCPRRTRATARPSAHIVADQGPDEAVLEGRVLDELRTDLGGAAPLYEVIVTFLEKAPSVLAALRDAATRFDAGEMRRAAHMIKGTSSMLGARRLAAQCAELELQCRAGVVPDAPGRVAAIEASYRAVEAALRATLDVPAG